jgi:hypothetical protein
MHTAISTVQKRGKIMAEEEKEEGVEREESTESEEVTEGAEAAEPQERAGEAEPAEPSAEPGAPSAEPASIDPKDMIIVPPPAAMLPDNLPGLGWAKGMKEGKFGYEICYTLGDATPKGSGIFIPKEDLPNVHWVDLFRKWVTDMEGNLG